MVGWVEGKVMTKKHWTDGLWERTKNLLDQAGIKTISQLASKSEWELYRHKGLGRKTVDQLRKKLQEHGLEFSRAPYRPTKSRLPEWLPVAPPGMLWEPDCKGKGLGLRQSWGNMRMIPLTRSDAIKMNKEAELLTALVRAHYAAIKAGAIVDADTVSAR